jgi:hypothetical protein
MLQHGRFHYRASENSDTHEGRDLMVELDEFKTAKAKIPRRKFPLEALPEITLETGREKATRIAEERIAKHASALNFHGAHYARPVEHYQRLRLAAVVENMFVENGGENPITALSARKLDSLQTKYNKAAGKMIRKPAFYKILNDAEERRNLPTLTVPFVNDTVSKKKDAEKWAKKVLDTAKSPYHAVRIMKHGFLNYGRSYMSQTSAYKAAKRAIAKEEQVYAQHGPLALRQMSLSQARLDPLSFIQPEFEGAQRPGQWRDASSMALNWDPTPLSQQL